MVKRLYILFNTDYQSTAVVQFGSVECTCNLVCTIQVEIHGINVKTSRLISLVINVYILFLNMESSPFGFIYIQDLHASTAVEICTKH